MDAAKNAANSASETAQSAGSYVSDKVNETVAGGSKEANKSALPLAPHDFPSCFADGKLAGVAKDSNAGIGDRASAGMDYMKDSADQKGYSVR